MRESTGAPRTVDEHKHNAIALSCAWRRALTGFGFFDFSNFLVRQLVLNDTHDETEIPDRDCVCVCFLFCLCFEFEFELNSFVLCSAVFCAFVAVEYSNDRINSHTSYILRGVNCGCWWLFAVEFIRATRNRCSRC